VTILATRSWASEYQPARDVPFHGKDVKSTEVEDLLACCP